MARTAAAGSLANRRGALGLSAWCQLSYVALPHALAARKRPNWIDPIRCHCMRLSSIARLSP
ncbi:hypothetical protein XFF6990_190072 [Xanthomonas citri pv. fuscans]|nr:hypothetical protein XFF6990_190072 [Xanthomonas citri pv. fuscans]